MTAMEMYGLNAPAWENTLDTRIGMPESIDEILLNRTCYTQACLERNTAMIENLQRVQLAQSQENEAKFKMLKGDIDVALKSMEKIIGKCVDRVDAVFERLGKVGLFEGDTITARLLAVDQKHTDLNLVNKEQRNNLDNKIKELNNLVVLAIQEERDERARFQKNVLDQNQEDQVRMEKVYDAMETLLKSIKEGQPCQEMTNRLSLDHSTNKPTSLSLRKTNSPLSRLRRTLSEAGTSASPRSPIDKSPRFHDGNNMESPRNNMESLGSLSRFDRSTRSSPKHVFSSTDPDNMPKKTQAQEEAAAMTTENVKNDAADTSSLGLEPSHEKKQPQHSTVPTVKTKRKFSLKSIASVFKNKGRRSEKLPGAGTHTQREL